MALTFGFPGQSLKPNESRPRPWPRKDGEGERRGRVVSEVAFKEFLSAERKRAERSGKAFLLMLADLENLSPLNGGREVCQKISSLVLSSTRETDVTGWFEEEIVVGAILTELARSQRDSVVEAVSKRFGTALPAKLSPDQLSKLRLSFHSFPEDWDGQDPSPPVNLSFYPDLLAGERSKRKWFLLKRVMDVLGAAVALLVCAPVFVLIAAVIKLTSKGPVFFRQERVGRFGVRFTFLKFRTMYASSDPKVHQDFVRRFISGDENLGVSGNTKAVYKLTEDSRVTPFGKILRRTSLDELPQLLNVLRGEMSLVGPRPPIPYELESYDVWHRCRVLEVKPGITGLWQVRGRSRLKFNDMVRLDLHYARKWSLWLDIKILLQTPRAVVAGEGAY